MAKKNQTLAATSHTPGPWRMIARNRMLAGGRGPGYDVQQVAPDGLGEFICDKATEADARLISAAPRLLRELKRLLHETENGMLSCGLNTAAAAVAAVREAEGPN